MASSSADFPSSFYCSSNSTFAQVQPRKYGVFLNSRGKDTREGFVSFLYRDLYRQGILAYLDKVELEKGADISEIKGQIQDFNIAVIVFSKEYASSSFCLDELVKIMECRQTAGLHVLVVFYHVNPEEVKYQTGSFSREFDNHQQSYDEPTIAKWRTTLKNAASVAGWNSNSKDIRNEADLVDKIVEVIRGKLRLIEHPDDLKGLVGMHLRVKEIESLLCFEKVNEVRIVGIWGMGGIGKTTLAEAIFQKNSSHFYILHFLKNVREKSKKEGLPTLKDELYACLLNGANKSIHTFSSSSLRNMPEHKKVLIVLDDVDKFEQIESLVGNYEWFGHGSRIIITSRDKQLLKNGNVDSTYEVQQLVGHEALQLFSLFAFKQSYPLAERLELSYRVLEYAKGLPLALKVLVLFLQDRSKEDWESALNELQKIPNMEVQEVLKISYNGGLDTSAKEIFLRIACFFRGEEKTNVERILDSCGFFATINLSKLAEKALIVISNDNVEMHDLLQEMGRNIVRQESDKEPGKRSRLWNLEDIRHVLEEDRGANAIKGISLDMSKIINCVCVAPTAFLKMDQVKLLRFVFPNIWPYLWRSIEIPKKVECPQGLESLPKKLRYLRWDCYPLKALPSNVDFENLVELEISCSKIERPWTGKQKLSSLRVMAVNFCEHLIEMPDFSGALNLQIIRFTFCRKLQEVSLSIECLENLKELYLTGCQKIESVPSTKGLQSLKTLFLDGCKALKNLSESIEELNLDCTCIEEVASCSKLRSLKRLYLRCSNIRKIPELSTSVEGLQLSGDNHDYHSFEQSLKSSDLSQLHTLGLLDWRGLGNIVKMNFGQLRSLYLSYGSFKYIGSIKQLSCLESLTIAECKKLRSMPELPPHLKNLVATNCRKLQMVTNSNFAPVETLENLLDFRENFSFSNCHQLNEDARRNVSGHAQQIRQLYAQKALYQLPKSVGRSDEVIFVYPGNEIPDWIDRQSTGSSITLDLPHNLCDDRNFLGFVLCAISDGQYMEYPEFFDIPICCDRLFESGDAARNVKLTLGHPSSKKLWSP